MEAEGFTPVGQKRVQNNHPCHETRGRVCSDKERHFCHEEPT